MQFDLARPQLRHGQRNEPARSAAAHPFSFCFCFAVPEFLTRKVAFAVGGASRFFAKVVFRGKSFASLRGNGRGEVVRGVEKRRRERERESLTEP